MRTCIDKVERSDAEDSLWLGFKKLCPAEIFLYSPFLSFFSFSLFLYIQIYRVRHYENREKIRSKNGIKMEKERIVWLRVKQKKKKKKKRENAPLWLLFPNGAFQPSFAAFLTAK